MLRKIVLALGASAIIGAAAFSPTAAGGHYHGHHGWHHGWRHGFGIRFVVPTYYPDRYTVHRIVWTPSGKRVRRVEVCE